MTSNEIVALLIAGVLLWLVYRVFVVQTLDLAAVGESIQREVCRYLTADSPEDHSGFLRTPVVLIVFSASCLMLFLTFIWPTLYRYETPPPPERQVVRSGPFSTPDVFSSLPIRTNRITGSRELIFSKDGR